jgi:zinc transporter ZupT
MSDSDSKRRQGMSFKGKALLWALLSFLIGGVGGYICWYLGGPFSFGFFLGFVLTGLTGMFVLAVHVAESHHGPR